MIVGSRRHLLSAAILLPVLALTALPGSAPAQAEVPHLLVWTATYGFRHPSITTAQQAFAELADEGHFTVTITENPADISAQALRDADAMVWVSTTGKPPLTEQQRDDIIRYAGCGGGTVGFHATADSNYGWPEHAELFGAQFDSHPQNAGAGEVRMLVEDQTHPVTQAWHGQDSFLFDDEYYRWRAAKGIDGVSNPRNLPSTNVLLSLDETTVEEGIQDGPLAYEEHQPVAWAKTFRDRGRVYYNNMGHSESTWEMPEFRTALVAGVDWVTEVGLDETCFDGDAPLPPAASPPAADPATIGQPCTVPELMPREGGAWETSGEARALTPDGDEQDLAAGVPGGLGWGAQTWILDLSSLPAAGADVTLTLEIPLASDDYDLSVTTAWGWYGSQDGVGATTEEVVITNAPHCAYLHVAGDNMFASGAAGGPTVRATVDPGDPVEVVPVLRVAGQDRFGTAVLASQQSFPADASAGAVVLARGDSPDGFADALAGVPLADDLGAPLLLSLPTSLPQVTATELERVLPAGGTVHVLGGDAAISPQVQAEVEALGYQVQRVFGPDRFATAVAIAEALGNPDTVMLATGFEFADALSAGPAAAEVGAAILLTPSTEHAEATDAYLAEFPDVTTYAIGGPAARQYPDADHGLVGSDRRATAVQVASFFFDAPTNIGVARSNDFPDALSGGARMARLGGPILLTPTASLDERVGDHLCDLTSIVHGELFGGTAALGQDVETALAGRVDRTGC